MTLKEYYTVHLKKGIGKCKMCGKDTAFISLDAGYKKYCSSKCAKNDPEVKEKTANTCMEKFGASSPMKNKDVLNKAINTYKAKTGYARPGQNPECKEKVKATSLAKYDTESPNQASVVKDNKRKALLDKYGVDNVSKLESVKIKKINTCRSNNQTDFGYVNIMRDPVKRSQIVAKGKFPIIEKKVLEFLNNRNIPHEHNFNINGKSFDFVIFNSNKEPSLVIELDGEYYHGLKCDYDGVKVKQHGIADHERFALLPDNCKFLVANSDTPFDKIATEILRILNIDYERWIKDIVESLPVDFPFPNYNSIRLNKDYEKLCTYDYKQGQSIGMSLIQHFHHSVWKCQCKGKISPYDAWNNKELLEKCVRNRVIYSSVLSSQNIANGFGISKIAPKISVFNPSIARYLLLKYTPDAKVVRDPFSGFSGRMLGACSLNMEYLGSDINSTTVNEAIRLKNFLNLKASLEVKDIEAIDDNNIYDVCITCPPYNLKETWCMEIKNKSCDEWIDILLDKIRAKTYIIIVDNTVKYKDYIAESIEHKSHFVTSNEKVIVIDRD